MSARRFLRFVGRVARRPQSRLLRTEKDLWIVARAIAERLDELALEQNHPKSARLKLDRARLLANAVRDGIDPESWARIESLLEALEALQTTLS
jgi:uncharacterized alpha-E superfamily protein